MKYLKFDRTIRAGDFLTAVAVLVALVGLVPQWRSIHIAQRNLDNQINGLRKLAQQIRSEATARLAGEAQMGERALTQARHMLEMSKSQIAMNTSADAVTARIQRYFAACFEVLAEMLDAKSALTLDERETLRTSIVNANRAMMEISAVQEEKSIAFQRASDQWQSQLERMSIKDLGVTEYERRSEKLSEDKRAELQGIIDEAERRLKDPIARFRKAVETIGSQLNDDPKK